MIGPLYLQQYNKMTLDLGNCKYCQHVLAGVVVRHRITECQYRQSMFCCVCMAYGHADDDCPNKIAWAIRKGEDASNATNHTLVVKDSEEDIKGVLRSYGLAPGTRILENRKLLRNLANSLKPPKLVLFTS